jgi:hypothetical protein
MRFSYGLAIAAALLVGCSSSSSSTKPTAANENPTGTTQPTSIEGTGSTAATSGNTPPSTAQPPSQSPNPPSSTYGTSPSDTGSSAQAGQGAAGSSSGQGSAGAAAGGAAAGSAGSMYGSQQGSTSATPGTTDNLKTVTGQVAKVDQNSITLDQSAGGVTLTIDSNTQVLRRGQPIAAGISAIHEGQQIRASFDPASNRADKIEVMGHLHMHHKKTAPPPSDTTPSDGSNPR